MEALQLFERAQYIKHGHVVVSRLGHVDEAEDSQGKILK